MTDSLVALNNSSGKYSAWTVRVLYPEVINYSYRSKTTGTMVKAAKFQAWLVSRDPSEYVYAVISNKDGQQDKVTAASKRFVAGSLWRMTNVHHDSSVSPLYVGAPNKYVVDLSKTNMVLLMKGAAAEDAEVVKHINPPMRLKDVLQLTDNRAVDMAVFVTNVENTRTSRASRVRNIAAADDSGASAQLAAWDGAVELFGSVASKACLIMGAKVTCKSGGCTLNVNEGARVFQDESPRLKELFESCNGAPVESRTMVTISAEKAIDCSGPAIFLCCAVLEALMTGEDKHLSEDSLVQIMNVYLISDGATPNLRTQDGSRLWLAATARDWSGSVAFCAAEKVILSIYGFKTRAELEAAEQDPKGLTPVAKTFHVRGAKRGKNFMIGEILASDCMTEIRDDGLAALARLSPNRGRDAIMSAPISAIVSNGIQNMGVRDHAGVVLAPLFVRLLVKGTEKTKLDENAYVKGARSLTSSGVKCLLSEGEQTCTIRAYTNENELLAYLLDTRHAVILISGVIPNASGGSMCFIASSIEIVEKEDVEVVRKAMLKEYYLTCGFTSHGEVSLSDVPARKRARRLEAWPSVP